MTDRWCCASVSPGGLAGQRIDGHRIQAARSQRVRLITLQRQQRRHHDGRAPPAAAESAARRADWERRAGVVAPYRESVGITDDKQAIGPMPLDRAEPREAWWASVRELELPDEAALMRAMGRGELEARVAEYERTRAAAPADVSRRLDAVSQVLLSAQQQAQAARLTGNADMEVSAQALDGDLAGEQSTLQVKQAVREEWAEATAEQKRAAEAARDELRRRGIDPDERQQPNPDRDAEPEGVPDPDPFDPEIDTGFDPELDANPDLDGDASLDDVPLTDEQWAEASARPRPYPAMDPEVHAKLKAEQTARVEADRQERIEAAARQTPVFDGEMANTGMLRL